MHISLLGTRGSLPTPGPDFVRYGGNTSCVAISRSGEPPAMFLDAGTGIANAKRLMGGELFRGSVLLSHLHWDHIYGLPFFRPGDHKDARVDIYLPAQSDPVSLLDRVMSPPIFPISTDKLRGAWNVGGLDSGHHQIEGFEVLALEIPHKGGLAFGYRIEDESGSVAYLPDHSPTSRGSGPSGHGELHETAMQLAQDVDLLIHDSQYTPDEFADRHDWGHCTYEYPIELARAAGAKRTLLFHHDPGHTDDFLDTLAATIDDPAISFAVEGAKIRIGEGDQR